MTVSPFDDAVLGGLFGDPECAALFSTEATIARYNEVEAALTTALREEGLIEGAAADAILAVLTDFAPSHERLARDTLADGMPLPGYVRALREAVGEPHAAGVHRGSTSQDIIDTALALTLQRLNAIFARRLETLDGALGGLIERDGARELMGVTRMQRALPITAAHRVAAWRRPLRRLADELSRLRPTVEVLQFGGPVGLRNAYEGRDDAVAMRMAKMLGLSEPGHAAHTDRAGLAAYGGWLAQTSAALGKIGQDLCLMALHGDELARTGGGSSSAMAHKQNPIDAELLVTLARYNAAQSGALGQAMVHELERSGISWALEWMVLPSMCCATGCGLLAADRLLGSITRIGASDA